MQKYLWPMAILGATFLAGCDEPDTFLPGLRENPQSVLADPEINPEDSFVNRSVAFGAGRAVSNASWQQGPETPSTRTTHPALGASPKLIWSTSIGEGDARRHRISTDPIVANGAIYTMDSLSVVQATGANGAPLWTTNLTPEREKAGEASGGGLAYGDGMVFVTTGYGRLHALDAKTGAEKWTQTLLGSATGRPAYSRGIVYITSTDSTAWAIDAKTGYVLWQLDALADANNILNNTGPAISKDLVIFPFGSGEIQAAFRKGGLVLWSAVVSGNRRGRAINQIGDITASPVIAGNSVYAATSSGRMLSVDLENGERNWVIEAGAQSPIWAAGGSGFFVNDLNQLVRISLKNGEKIWAVDLPGYEKNTRRRTRAIFGHYGPILASGRLITVSTDGKMREFDPKSGETLRVTDLPALATASPIIAKNTLYVVGSDGQLHAFR